MIWIEAVMLFGTFGATVATLAFLAGRYWEGRVGLPALLDRELEAARERVVQNLRKATELVEQRRKELKRGLQKQDEEWQGYWQEDEE